MTASRILFRAADWPHRVDVQRVANTFDDAGGRLVATITLYRTVPCLVRSVGPNEARNFERQGMEATHTVVLHSNPGLRNGDRLLFQTGRILTVTGVTDEFNLGVIYTVACVEQVA